MKKIYVKDNEIFLEHEAMDEARKIAEQNSTFLETITRMNPWEIWNLLSSESQEKIIEDEIDIILDEEFECREFTDDEI